MHEIYIYDIIGRDFFGEGVTAASVRDELKKIPKGETVTVRINSPGGIVDEGHAIYNMLAERGNIRVKVDSLAASIASIIAMAGDEIEIAANARMMIHEGWTFGMGHKRELAKTVERLASLDSTLSETYAARSGKHDAAHFLAKMEAETWFTADEAVIAGLADKVGQKLKVKAAVRSEMRTSPGCIAAYWQNMPLALLDEPEGAELPAAAPYVAALDLRLRIERASHRETPFRDSLEKRLTEARRSA